jgi:hypothetical protein
MSQSTVINSAKLADFVELAASFVPQRATDLKWKLRAACPFIPMPLCLGWGMVSERAVTQPNTYVAGLCITDMATGATREATAGWTHSLYQHIMDSLPQGRVRTMLPRGTTLLRLKEVSFHEKIGWQHHVLIITVIFQFVLGSGLISTRQRREGWLILAGVFIRILQCIYDWKFPIWHIPREVSKRRYYAVHTRMTTRLVLVLSHDPPRHSPRINVEDAAAPIRRARTGRHAWIEQMLEQALRFTAWMLHATSILTPSTGYMLAFTLLIGTGMQEMLLIFTHATPAFSHREEKETHESLLDMLTAACQAAGVVSVGFIESILPDPTGQHTDYNWISSILKGDMANTQVHPTHVSKVEVLSFVRRRQNANVQSVTPGHD